jgi:hypothetical protein
LKEICDPASQLHRNNANFFRSKIIMKHLALASGLLLGSAVAFADTAAPALNLQASAEAERNHQAVVTAVLDKHADRKLDSALDAQMDKLAQEMEARMAAQLEEKAQARLQSNSVPR